jgi:NADPH:quinone reductase-like Zn-dependent oxidoreductase
VEAGAEALSAWQGLFDHGRLDLVRPGGRVVSVAEEPQAPGIDAVYFVVEPSSEQLVQIARLVDGGVIRPLIDSVFPLCDARAHSSAASPAASAARSSFVSPA